jgi:hypothetical protein
MLTDGIVGAIFLIPLSDHQRESLQLPKACNLALQTRGNVIRAKGSVSVLWKSLHRMLTSSLP